jgi:CheY-like chemotaxis protein
MLKKILVVDDVVEILQLFKVQLAELGYQDVFLVDNGNEALEILRQHDFDLVFLDIELPGMDGMSILDNIQLDHPNLPVVMCSAHNSVDNVKMSWESGAKGFLVKPVDSIKLKNLLNKISAM